MRESVPETVALSVGPADVPVGEVRFRRFFDRPGVDANPIASAPDDGRCARATLRGRAALAGSRAPARPAPNGSERTSVDGNARPGAETVLAESPSPRRRRLFAHRQPLDFDGGAHRRIDQRSRTEVEAAVERSLEELDRTVRSLRAIADAPAAVKTMPALPAQAVAVPSPTEARPAEPARQAKPGRAARKDPPRTAKVEAVRPARRKAHDIGRPARRRASAGGRESERRAVLHRLSAVMYLTVACNVAVLAFPIGLLVVSDAGRPGDTLAMLAIVVIAALALQGISGSVRRFLEMRAGLDMMAQLRRSMLDAALTPRPGDAGPWRTPEDPHRIRSFSMSGKLPPISAPVVPVLLAVLLAGPVLG